MIARSIRMRMQLLALQFRSGLARGLVLAAVLLSMAPLASADDGDFRIETRQGTVQSTDFAANKMVVGGVSYDVALDANVTLGGTYGAFTMIKTGMNVEIVLRRYLASGQREVIEVRELPPGVKPEEY